ncbi:MAG: formate dehydrogenase accessory protein FdhE [bacterium]|nr:formate dehydrogenase accessory protein FdhE [bacterium]
MTKSKLREAKKEFDALNVYEHISPQQVSFYKDLVRLLSKYQLHLKKENTFPSLTSKQALNKIKEEKSLLDLSQIKLGEKYLEDIFNDLNKLILKYGFFEKNEGEQLKQAYQKKKLNLKQLVIENITCNGEYIHNLSTILQVSSDILIFIAIHSIKPILELACIAYSDLIKFADWYKNTCPICGSPPYISKLSKEEGKRVLKCSLCDYEWLFSRLMCPFCNNEDQEFHKYFYIEEDSPYRVDVCDKCHQYIKTVDERKYPSDKRINLFMDHISTIYLDFKAYEEGYTNNLIFYNQNNLVALNKIN